MAASALVKNVIIQSVDKYLLLISLKTQDNDIKNVFKSRFL